VKRVRGGKREKRRRKSRASGAAARARVPAATRSGEAASLEGDAAAAISFSNLSLHELFEQQARTMLDNADLDEEQKQSILVAMACPCCGTGGMSFSVKLKR